MRKQKEDPTTPHVRKCRYKCDEPVTHYCSECANGSTGLSGYYCQSHAERHNRMIADASGSILAVKLPEAGEESTLP